MKRFFTVAGVAIACSILTLVVYHSMGFGGSKTFFKVVPSSSYGQLVSNNQYGKAGALPVDFTYAARISTPSVVHITSTFMAKGGPSLDGIPEQFKDFFGEDFFQFRGPEGPRKAEAAGSGVIIGSGGYIITNNHVIENADEINVTLSNKRNFKATVVGTDPSTDLALLKINSNNLPQIVIGNSDSVKVGEWTMAVGNPFNLASTVTAGIISAKGRNIHILQDNFAIESFIQTDAAVNPGNSGGALVNLKGELIGINTAIATPTGTYAGYAFAIPTGIIRKIVDDLIKYGVVQRGFLGLSIREVDEQLVKELNLKVYQGAFVDSLTPGGSAQKAGIQKGDVIVKIEDIEINGPGRLLELISQRRPGDIVRVTVNRGGKIETMKVVLQNSEGNGKIIVKKEEDKVLKTLGLQLEEIPLDEKKKLGIKNGVRVAKLLNGKVKLQTDMREGFIITRINGNEVTSAKSASQAFGNIKKGGVMVEGIYPGHPNVFYYAFGV